MKIAKRDRATLLEAAKLLSEAEMKIAEARRMNRFLEADHAIGVLLERAIRARRQATALGKEE